MAILFDMDGTLIDPQQGILAAIRYALSEMGRPIPVEAALLDWIGPPLANSFSAELKLSVDHSTVAEAIRLFRVYYADRGIFEADVFPGVIRMLEELVSAEKTLYIATSKPTPYAKRIAAHFQFDRYFAGIYGSDLEKNHDGKTDLLEQILQEEVLTAAACTMIGDRQYDITAAINTGISPIAVLWGFGSEEELIASGAIKIVADIAELTIQLKVR